jgi:hypothetical protein
MGGEWKISYRWLPTTGNDILFACQRTTGTSYLECSFIALQGKKLLLYPIMETKPSISHKVTKSSDDNCIYKIDRSDSNVL